MSYPGQLFPLQNHKLWSDRFVSVISDGEGPRLKFEREDGQTDSEKTGTCERLRRQWCHLAFMQGHASDSKCSWSARISSYATCRSKPITPRRIQDHFTASNSWRLAPVTKCQPHLCHPGFFGHFRPSVWPSSCSNFDLGPSPSISTKKKAYKIRDYDFGVQFSLI